MRYNLQSPTSWDRHSAGWGTPLDVTSTNFERWHRCTDCHLNKYLILQTQVDSLLDLPLEVSAYPSLQQLFESIATATGKAVFAMDGRWYEKLRTLRYPIVWLSVLCRRFLLINDFSKLSGLVSCTTRSWLRTLWASTVTPPRRRRQQWVCNYNKHLLAPSRNHRVINISAHLGEVCRLGEAVQPFLAPTLNSLNCRSMCIRSYISDTLWYP